MRHGDGSAISSSSIDNYRVLIQGASYPRCLRSQFAIT